MCVAHTVRRRINVSRSCSPKCVEIGMFRSGRTWSVRQYIVLLEDEGSKCHLLREFYNSSADEGWIVCPRFCTWLSKTNNSTVVVMLETRWLCLSRKERKFSSTWEIRSIICWYYLLGWRSMIVATHLYRLVSEISQIFKPNTKVAYPHPSLPCHKESLMLP